MSNTKLAIIISAFPGCGKSKFYEESQNTNLKVLDSDSSNFSWIKDELGNNTKERNPEFPNNYINHIKENLDKADVIFVSSHESVRKALEQNNLEYVLVYPNKNVNKEEWIKRFIKRGDSESFINFISSNWDKFISELELETFPTHYTLDEYNYLGTSLTLILK